MIAPSTAACAASDDKLPVRIGVKKLGGGRLQLVSVDFYLDKGIKRIQHKTVYSSFGKEKVRVIVYVPNATAKHLPAARRLSLSRLTSGSHILTVDVTYRVTISNHGHKKIRTYSADLRITIAVC